ncbi:MAG: multiheme c-type cytochrome [bacterium]
MSLSRSFAALVLVLLALVAWAAYRDADPSWQRYQRELLSRERARIEAELAQARADLEAPAARAELARLDERLRVARADTASARLAELHGRVAALEKEIDAIYVALRKADVDAQQPDAVRARKALGDRLEAAQQAYVTATGTWPPDTTRLQKLWAVRDSLGDVLVALEGPVAELRSRLDAKQGEAQDLRAEAQRIAAPRDSLERARAKLLEPVTSREAALARLRDRPLRVREIASADGMTVARCPTCHGTLDDPPGVHSALPAGDIFRDVPCTVCHGGHGRALDVEHAHRGLLASAGFGAGRYSLKGRIAQLASGTAAEREEAREELRRITGLDPAEERATASEAANADSVAAASWGQWWLSAQGYFDPTDSEADEGAAPTVRTVDAWSYSMQGRPLRYVGSAKCLGCHEVLHREHSRRWLATKFRSLERLAKTADPRPCLPCHSTGYDATTGKYVEPGVTCEGCHGPGERYNEMMVVGQDLVAKGEGVRGRALLAHASRLAREAVSLRLLPSETGENNVCVTCHHPRQQRAGCPAILQRSALPATGDDEEKPHAKR